MIDEKRTFEQRPLDETGAQAESVDKGRRAALLNIGALAGAAPAVAVLLTPSASRGDGGGSPCEHDCGDGRGRPPGYKPSDTGAPGGGDSGSRFLGKRDS
ncbi:MAG: hypothetical protein KDK53_04065 [Maritimibacter sp.]|nr:hypothetical protein [Maritimibacter sp.]